SRCLVSNPCQNRGRVPSLTRPADLVLMLARCRNSGEMARGGELRRGYPQSTIGLIEQLLQSCAQQRRQALGPSSIDQAHLNEIQQMDPILQTPRHEFHL